MQKTTLLVVSLFAAVLLCSAFSLAAAQEDTEVDGEPNLIAPAPDSTPNPDVPEKIAPDENSTITQDDEIYQLYQDGRESAYDAQAPGAESEANLIATDTSTPDYTLPLAVLGVVLAVTIGGAVGIVSYRKREAKTAT